MIESEVIAAMVGLADKGIYKVEVEFSGSGDSGDIDEYRYLDKDNNEIYKIDDDSSDFIQTLAEDIINNHYGYDWYNNEGGRGTLYINFEEKEWDIQGVQYVEEPTSESGELTDIIANLSE